MVPGPTARELRPWGAGSVVGTPRRRSRRRLSERRGRGRGWRAGGGAAATERPDRQPSRRSGRDRRQRRSSTRSCPRDRPRGAEPRDDPGVGTDTGRMDAMAEPDDRASLGAVPPRRRTPSRARHPPPAPRRFSDRSHRRPPGWCRRAAGGGWWADEHGPMKPALERIDTTTAHDARERHGDPRRPAGRAGARASATSGMPSSRSRQEMPREPEVGRAEAAPRWTAESSRRRAPSPTRVRSWHGAESHHTALNTEVDQADRAFRAASEQVIARWRR